MKTSPGDFTAAESIQMKGREKTTAPMRTST
jgi:hypothetical protein